MSKKYNIWLKKINEQNKLPVQILIKNQSKEIPQKIITDNFLERNKKFLQNKEEFLQKKRDDQKQENEKKIIEIEARKIGRSKRESKSAEPVEDRLLNYQRAYQENLRLMQQEHQKKLEKELKFRPEIHAHSLKNLQNDILFDKKLQVSTRTTFLQWHGTN